LKIILFTQNDPFYLAESTKDFIQKVKESDEHEIIKAIVTPPSPFGKKEKSYEKAIKTLKIFGIRFFIFYSFKFIIRRFFLNKSVIKEIKKSGTPLWILDASINNKKNVQILKNLNPDVIIIIAGNQIIKKQVLDIPKYGVINAHSSLLPNYKGLMPTFWVLKNRDLETGVTLYKLTEGIDDGPIISQRKIKIDKNTSQSELIIKCKEVANDLILDSLDMIKNEDEFTSNEGGSYYMFPTRMDVKEFYRNGNKFF